MEDAENSIFLSASIKNKLSKEVVYMFRNSEQHTME